MAEIHGSLWQFNLAKVVIVDVSDDYRLMQPPMPSDFYPVVCEMWLPKYNLTHQLSSMGLINGYLYDWHERPENECGDWYVGVVDAQLTQEPAFRAQFEATG